MTEVKPAIKKTNAKSTTAKKTPAEKPSAKAATATTAVKSDTTEAQKPKLTQGQKLLKTMTAQKAAKKALLKGVASTHVSFDDEGNEANVETVIQKIESPAKVVNPKKTNKNRPAVKKPEPISKTTKKRSADEMEQQESETKEQQDKSENKDSKKPPKKAKKPKKSKTEIEEMKRDSKQEEALAYVRLFVTDREAWKFKKVQQIWLLSNLYEIPESEFENVLEYLKDLQGSAREKTKQEAQEKIPVKKPEAPAVVSNALTGYADVNTGNDYDDFDAEKLLAQANTAPVAVQEEKEEEEEEEESDEVKRARLILQVLS